MAIVLSGLNYQDIDALLTFIYSGEVSLCDAQLPSFLKTAETLQVYMGTIINCMHLWLKHFLICLF